MELMEVARTRMKQRASSGKVVAVDETRFANWDGYIHFFQVHCDELKDDLFHVMPQMTQWYKNALPDIVKSRRDQEQNTRNQKRCTTRSLCGKLLAKQVRWARSPSHTVASVERHVPKYDFIWCSVEDGPHNKKTAKRMVGTWCVKCGKKL